MATSTNPAQSPLGKDAFVRAALEIIDEEGVDGLTLKKLGDHLGVSHTAVYRYFDGIPSVLIAMRTSILESLGSRPFSATDPRSQIVEFALRFREVVSAHPSVAPLFLVAAGNDDSLTAPSVAIVRALEALGFRGKALTTSYQALESFVAGGTLWDFAGAPHHLESRLSRMRLVRHTDFDRISREEKQVARHNDESFLLGLESMLDGLLSRIK